jgi:hypothetical protein
LLILIKRSKIHVCDYDDFYIASQEEAVEQINAACNILEEVKVYLQEKKIIE